jgi:DNA mismatch endonuclease (patch repair protein)
VTPVAAPAATSATVVATMKGNRSADTRPELALRAALHARGMRFRKDYMVRTTSGVKAKVDVAFTRARVAVFLDGCFWHGCPIHGNTPKAKAQYWRPKLEHNRTRDRHVTAALEADSWTVLRIWEHVPVAEAVERVVAAVEASAV